MIRRVAFSGLLLLYFVAGVLFAVYTPPWQAPDEPAHYNYVRQLSEGSLPVLEETDYDEAYRREIVSAGFAPDYSIEPLTYEDWQPPLYYLLQTPLFLLFDGALLPLRLFSVLLGAGVVYATYRAASYLWRDKPRWLPLTAAAFVAFLPQHVAMLASVNNDSLAELLIALLLWLLLTIVATGNEESSGGESRRVASRRWLLAGVLLGLGFLTKATVYLMAPVVALALVARYRDKGRSLLHAATLVFLPALLLGALWWSRNALVYGQGDVMAIAVHDRVVVGQLRTVDWLAGRAPLAAAQSFASTTFNSFWGQFGWMGVPMPPWVYRVLLLFSMVILLGLLLRALRAPPLRVRLSRTGPIVLAALLVMTLLLYVGYNVTYVQHQGRYLFPALVPIGILVAGGLSALARPLWARWPGSGWLIPAALAIGLFGLDLLALYRFILPALG